MADNEKCKNSGCSKESCEGCEQHTQSFQVEPNMYTDIKHVIGIVSGKGGVGKSMVTAALAVNMAQKGYKVGIMDADITGPSIPKMFGLKGPAEGTEEGILPSLTKNGIKVMSLNLLMENEETPVIWRGPVIANMVKQFWSDVMWGELDYLFVDMPPGTGDVPLTVFQSLPVEGIVLVTSPQDLVQMIVKKAMNMAETMHIPVIGMVENYSYLECPDCKRRIEVFGKSKVDEAAEATGTKVLGKVPILPELASLADEGRFEELKMEYFDEAVKQILK